MVETTRRGFLQGLLGTLVIAQVPASALVEAAMTIQPTLDPFAIKPPDGTTYQWVRSALLGEPDPQNVQLRLNNGWKFVLPEAHPGAPVSTLEKAIETQGLILMQKPTEEVQLDLAQQRAPHMDADYRVWRLLREAMREAAEKLAPELRHIGYTEHDIRLFTQRRMSVTIQMAPSPATASAAMNNA